MLVPKPTKVKGAYILCRLSDRPDKRNYTDYSLKTPLPSNTQTPPDKRVVNIANFINDPLIINKKFNLNYSLIGIAPMDWHLDGMSFGDFNLLMIENEPGTLLVNNNLKPEIKRKMNSDKLQEYFTKQYEKGNGLQIVPWTVYLVHNSVYHSAPPNNNCRKFRYLNRFEIKLRSDLGWNL